MAQSLDATQAANKMGSPDSIYTSFPFEKYGNSPTEAREAMKSRAGKGLVEIKTRVGTRARNRKNWYHLDPDIVVGANETGPSIEIIRSINDLRHVLGPAALSRLVDSWWNEHHDF